MDERTQLLAERAAEISTEELRVMPAGALSWMWREWLRLTRNSDRMRNALTTIRDDMSGVAARSPTAVIDLYRQVARDALSAYEDAIRPGAPAHIPVFPTPTVQATLDFVGRTGESDSATIERIMEMLLAIAPDFDYFFGLPRDGRGPSGV